MPAVVRPNRCVSHLDHDAHDVAVRHAPALVEVEAQPIEVRREDVVGLLGHERHGKLSLEARTFPTRRDAEHWVDEQRGACRYARRVEDDGRAQPSRRKHDQVGGHELGFAVYARDDAGCPAALDHDLLCSRALNDVHALDAGDELVGGPLGTDSLALYPSSARQHSAPSVKRQLKLSAPSRFMSPRRNPSSNADMNQQSADV